MYLFDHVVVLCLIICELAWSFFEKRDVKMSVEIRGSVEKVFVLTKAFTATNLPFEDSGLALARTRGTTCQELLLHLLPLASVGGFEVKTPRDFALWQLEETQTVPGGERQNDFQLESFK